MHILDWSVPVHDKPDYRWVEVICPRFKSLLGVAKVEQSAAKQGNFSWRRPRDIELGVRQRCPKTICGRESLLELSKKRNVSLPAQSTRFASPTNTLRVTGKFDSSSIFRDPDLTGSTTRMYTQARLLMSTRRRL